MSGPPARVAVCRDSITRESKPTVMPSSPGGSAIDPARMVRVDSLTAGRRRRPVCFTSRVNAVVETRCEQGSVASDDRPLG